MNVAKNSYVSLAYKLTVDGEVVENVGADAPLEFIFGTNMLLPKFEENLDNKVVGDKFAFTLTPVDAYGEIISEAVVELPKNIFEVEGKFDLEVVHVGAVLPMMDNDGNQMYGNVKEVADETVKMDFNHPMAGKTLNFEGEIVGVREASDEDMMKFMPKNGGCGCGDGGCGDGDCGDGCGDGGCGDDKCCQ